MPKQGGRDITIGIDGRCFLGPAAGTMRYARELSLGLQTALSAPQVLVYGPANMQLPHATGWAARTEPQPWWQQLPTILWYRWRAGQLAKRDNVGVFLAGANFLPAFGLHRRAVSNPARLVSVLVVHDLVAELFPRTLTWTHRLAHQLFLKTSIMQCDLLVANSHGTAKRLFARYGRKPDFVLYPPIDSRFKPQSQASVAAVKQAYGLPRRYILTVGTIEPRKNLVSLIQAFAMLAKNGHQLGALVIVGSHGWLHGDTNVAVTTARRSGLDIRLLGRVPDADLPPLYAGSQLFVLPSLYEGFGMPVAEALACGARVLATDMPETREAGGNQAFYCAPTADGLCLGIARALSATTTTSTQEPFDSEMPYRSHNESWISEVERLADLVRAKIRVKNCKTSPL